MNVSAWGVGGTAGVMARNEAWREAAVRVVTFSYDGDGDHNLTTLLPGVSSGNLRLFLGLRVGRCVHADVHPPVLADDGLLLNMVDSADLDEPSIVDLQCEIKFVGHTALLALRLWLAERKESIALNLTVAPEQTILHDLVAQPAVVFAQSACGAVVLAVMSGESNLFPGDVLIDIYVVDVRGLPPPVL